MEIDKKKENIERGIVELREMIDASEKIVFFGGAGTSTESGIRDFRGKNGLYREKVGDLSPETILSHDFFFDDPEAFYRYYRTHFLRTGMLPNPAHAALARLEELGKLTCVVTQNIDGLHEDAGSRTVYHLHGTVTRNYCTECGKEYPTSRLASEEELPRCECGGLVRPDVVLYGESLPEREFEAAITAIADADMLIVGGTSLTVYPAAGLLRFFRGKYLVILNQQPTPYDSYASLILRAPIGQVLGKATEGM